MNPTLLIAIFLPLFVIFITRQTNKKKILAIKQRLKSKAKGEKRQMNEMIKKFIGKECLIYTFDSQVIGTIKEVTDGAVMIENNSGGVEALNLDFIVRVREYPRGKNGKKKSVVLD